MNRAMSSDEFAQSRCDEFQKHVTAAIKMLMETKHLYQSVLLTSTDSYISIQDDKSRLTETLPAVTASIEAGWATQAVKPGARPIHVKIPDAKVFCDRCKRIEAYNPVFVLEVFGQIRQEREVAEGGTQQAFLLAYQCQACKQTPELFLIRRRGLRLTNEGRSPIEHTNLPSFIPKALHRFFGGAIIAHQSGQTLAGVFLLRTVLEQWARSASASKKEQADQVMDDYMATLPNDFKNRFPSMRALYGELSVDIHSAIGSADLFEQARGQVVQHFDARRMFGLGQ